MYTLFVDEEEFGLKNITLQLFYTLDKNFNVMKEAGCQFSYSKYLNGERLTALVLEFVKYKLKEGSKKEGSKTKNILQ